MGLIKKIVTTIMLLTSVVTYGSEKNSICLKIKKLQPRIKQERAEFLATSIAKYSRRHDIDSDLIIAIGFMESSYINQYGDNGGSVGYFQLQLPTIDTIYKNYGRTYDLPKITSKEELFVSVDTQILYMVMNIKLIQKVLKTTDERAILLSYNAGIGGYKKGAYNGNYYLKYRDIIGKIGGI